MSRNKLEGSTTAKVSAFEVYYKANEKLAVGDCHLEVTALNWTDSNVFTFT